MTSLLGAPIEARYRWQRLARRRTDPHPLVQAAYRAWHGPPSARDLARRNLLAFAWGFTLHVACREDLRRHFLRDDGFRDRRGRAHLDPRRESLRPLLPPISPGRSARSWPTSGTRHTRFLHHRPRRADGLGARDRDPLAPHFEWTPPPPGDRVFPRRGSRASTCSAPPTTGGSSGRARSGSPSYGPEPWMDVLLPVLDEIIALGRKGSPRWVLARVLPLRERRRRAHRLDPRAVPPTCAPSPRPFRCRTLTSAAGSRPTRPRRRDRTPIEALGDPKGRGSPRCRRGSSSASMRVLGAEGHEHAMDLVGGLLGVTQDPVPLALFPEIAWAILRSDGAAAAWTRSSRTIDDARAVASAVFETCHASQTAGSRHPDTTISLRLKPVVEAVLQRREGAGSAGRGRRRGRSGGATAQAWSPRRCRRLGGNGRGRSNGRRQQRAGWRSNGHRRSGRWRSGCRGSHNAATGSSRATGEARSCHS